MNPLISEAFRDGQLDSFIQSNLKDPWEGTLFEKYVFLNPKQKGGFGEIFTSNVLRHIGLEVIKAEKGTSPYDRYVNGKKCEIKFGLATRDKKGGVKKDNFIINHVSKEKEWEFLLFIGISDPVDLQMRPIWFTREDFKKYGCSCFNTQQGGKKIENDDYMCTNIQGLLSCDWTFEGLDTLKSWITKL